MITNIVSSTAFTLKDLATEISQGNVWSETYRRSTVADERYSTPTRPYYPYETDENGKWIVEGYEQINEPDWIEGFFINGLGSFTNVKYWDEGDGRQCGSVVKHEESGRYFVKTGTYSSWDSSYWDGSLIEIEPVQVTVTKFKDKATGKTWDVEI